MVMDRGDVFRATGPAPGAETKVKLGATRDGKLVAADVECLMDSGAYNGNPAGIPAFMATACYKLTDARSTGPLGVHQQTENPRLQGAEYSAGDTRV
jgi:CO/xanthine dehydrogenase Mo-binding subunit